MRISVIVPVYNGEKVIGDCVESILALSYPSADYELLVVDNASTDRTSRILASYRDRARILSEPTQGPAAARNRGLIHATGDLVAFTDADCTVEKSWLREIVAPLGDPAVGIVGGAILSRRPCNAIEKFGEQIHDHKKAIEHYTPPYAITSNWASRRSVLDEVGRFDPELLRCEDCDLAYRVFAAGYRIVFAPRAVIYHRNERNLLGLAREGYEHGYHSIPLLRKHEQFVEKFRGAARGNGAEEDSGPPARREAIYWGVFNFGKSAGRIMGSMRQSR